MFEPETIIKLLRAVRMFEVGRDADGNPLVKSRSWRQRPRRLRSATANRKLVT